MQKRGIRRSGGGGGRELDTLDPRIAGIETEWNGSKGEEEEIKRRDNGRLKFECKLCPFVDGTWECRVDL